MHILLTVFWLLIAVYAIGKLPFFKVDGLKVTYIQLVFLLKVLVGFALWAIYTYHYTYRDTSDAFRYFDDAMVIREMLFENPSHFFRFLFGIGLDQNDVLHYHEQFRGWSSAYSYGIVNDNPTIIRINVVISLFSFGYYQVHTIFMAFISLIGGMAIFKGIIKIGGLSTVLSFITAFLIPSVLFWSSGVLKEAPLMAILGLLFYHLVLWIYDGKRPALLWVFLFTCCLFFIKGYVILLFLPAVVSLLLCRPFSKKPWLTFMAVHLVLGGIAFSGMMYQAGDFLYVLQKKQQDFVNVAKMQDAGSYIEPLPMEGVSDMMLALPRALYRTYMRPDLRDLSSAFHVIAAFENLIMILLFALMLFYFKKVKGKKEAMLYWCLSTSIILGFVIGFCVPIIGASVRYKIPVLPFVILGILLLTDFDRLKRKWAWFDKVA